MKSRSGFSENIVFEKRFHSGSAPDFMSTNFIVLLTHIFFHHSGLHSENL